MEKHHGNKVIIIGAGNLATNLSAALFKTGFRISAVVSNHIETAKLLADRFSAKYSSSIGDIEKDADLYILAVPDKTIPEVLSELPEVNGIVVHASGVTPIDMLKTARAKGYGVFYPFQTLSKSRQVDFSEVPLLLEADSPETYQYLNHAASLISKNVVQVDSLSRSWIHLSGVFANNYTNHVITIAQVLLSNVNIDKKILKPLVEETITKAFQINPFNAQTGPAVRFDDSTLEKHIEMLENRYPELVRIYKELSLSIQSFTKINCNYKSGLDDHEEF